MLAFVVEEGFNQLWKVRMNDDARRFRVLRDLGWVEVFGGVRRGWRLDVEFIKGLHRVYAKSLDLRSLQVEFVIKWIAAFEGLNRANLTPLFRPVNRTCRRQQTFFARH